MNLPSEISFIVSQNDKGDNPKRPDYRGEVVIGVRIAPRTTKNPGQREGIFVNLPKSTRLSLTGDDQVIVLAEA